jgi:hypothetical protein
MASVKSNDLSFKYEAFGLKIHSAIPLQELRPSESETADIIIYLGEVDLPTENVLNEEVSYKVTKNAIYRFWDVIGKFKITKSSIIIDAAHGVNKIILEYFLLGSVFATLLRLRGLFVLHASCVNINGSAIAFSGFKGYGKSTTAMAFYNEGYPIVSDDYITIEFDDNNIPLISPGFPSLRLSPKSREVMGLHLEESTLNLEIIGKTYASVPTSFSNNKIPLKKIYILQRVKKSKIIDLKPQEAFIELVKNTFGIQMFSKLELPDNFFQCERIVKNVDVSILEISDSLEKIHELAKIVEDDIGNGL